MTILDIVLLIPVLLGLVFGILKGLRPTLWLLVVLLASLLSGMLLTPSIERLILDLSGVGSSNYPDAPGVAVLILEDKTALAYVSALIPTWITALLIVAFTVGGLLLNRYFVEPKLNAVSRISALVFGLAAGTAFSLLVAVQISRLPWLPAGRAASGSLLMAALRHYGEFILPALGGAR